MIGRPGSWSKIFSLFRKIRRSSPWGNTLTLPVSLRERSVSMREVRALCFFCRRIRCCVVCSMWAARVRSAFLTIPYAVTGLQLLQNPRGWKLLVCLPHGRMERLTASRQIQYCCAAVSVHVKWSIRNRERWFSSVRFQEPCESVQASGNAWLAAADRMAAVFCLGQAASSIYYIHRKSSPTGLLFLCILVCPYLGDFFPELWEANVSIAAMFEFHADDW